MPQRTPIRVNAERVADLSFQLLVLCQDKELAMAEEFGISQSEFRTIRFFRGEQHISQKVLHRRLGLSGSRLSRILDSLQHQGLIRRKEDPTDRREYVISLTPRGLELAKNLEMRHVQIHEDILKDIPEELHSHLSDGLAQMVESVGNWVSKREEPKAAR